MKKKIAMNAESPVVVAEVNYIINKMAEADSKKKECVNHYSKLYKATEDKLAELGITRADGKTKWGASYKFMLPKHNSKAYKAIKAFVGDKFEPNVNKAEMDYIIEKIRLAKGKEEGKQFTCHYSALHKATIKEIEAMGIKVDMLGSHGYRFHYPTKRSKAWYRLNMYGKNAIGADGKFVKKTA